MDRADQKLERRDTDDEEEADQSNPPAHRTAVETADDEAAEYFHQNVAGDHRDEKPEAEAERTHHERDELNRGDQRNHDQRRTVRHEQRKEFQAVAPEADDQDDREAHDGEDAGDAEMAGRGERMEPRHDADRHQPEKVRDQDEHEQRKDVGGELAPLGADVRVDHVADEAGEAFDGDLPPAGNQLALHAAQHEDPQNNQGQHHPQRT